MIGKFLGSVIAAFAPAQPATPQKPVAPADYSVSRNWLCLPGRDDVCSRPLATTALNANGYGSTGKSSVAASPAIDCFYVYPTVSNDEGLNSDLDAGEEVARRASVVGRRSGVLAVPADLVRRDLGTRSHARALA